MKPISITTRKGDTGMTSLLYGQRVSKCHPQIEAVGACDALTVAIGGAKIHFVGSELHDHLELVQKELVGLMGELATPDDSRERYLESKMERILPEHLERLDKLCLELEGKNIPFTHWSTPGNCIPSFTLESARVAARTAERRIVTLEHDDILLIRPLLLKYINRLSDWLWLLARGVESKIVK